jgi:hypothetical protein
MAVPSILDNSPFIPASFVAPESRQTAPQRQPSRAPQLMEFKGMYEINGRPYFLVAERNSSGVWLNPGEERDGMTVTDYDLTDNRISVLRDGNTIDLELNALDANPASMPVVSASPRTAAAAAASRAALRSTDAVRRNIPTSSPQRRVIRPSTRSTPTTVSATATNRPPPRTIGPRRGRINRPEPTRPSRPPMISGPPVPPPTGKPEMPPPARPPEVP